MGEKATLRIKQQMLDKLAREALDPQSQFDRGQMEDIRRWQELLAAECRYVATLQYEMQQGRAVCRQLAEVLGTAPVEGQSLEEWLAGTQPVARAVRPLRPRLVPEKQEPREKRKRKKKRLSKDERTLKALKREERERVAALLAGRTKDELSDEEREILDAIYNTFAERRRALLTR